MTGTYKIESMCSASDLGSDFMIKNSSSVLNSNDPDRPHVSICTKLLQLPNISPLKNPSTCNEFK